MFVELFLDGPASLPHGTRATFEVNSLPGAHCYLTRTYISGPTSPAPNPVNSGPFYIGSNANSGPIKWGNTAAVGTYSITATCYTSADPKMTSGGVEVTWT
jgi:hypothetical protein